MTFLDREELDYEDFIEQLDEDMYDEDIDLAYRGYQRSVYLEDENYRRLSDVIRRTSRDYENKMEWAMLIYYLSGGRNADHRGPLSLDSLVRNNLTNPEINWKGIFDYMDRRFSTSPRWLADEVEEMAKYLNPYREQLYPKATFVGF